MTKTIDELISELKEYDGELTVKVFSNGADKAYPISHVGQGHTDGVLDTYVSIVVDDDRNLVDLSKIWHDALEAPTTEPTRIIATDEKGFIGVFPLEKGREFRTQNGCIPWLRVVFCLELTKWAYYSDLLPKGGEK